MWVVLCSVDSFEFIFKLFVFIVINVCTYQDTPIEFVFQGCLCTQCQFKVTISGLCAECQGHCFKVVHSRSRSLFQDCVLKVIVSGLYTQGQLVTVSGLCAQSQGHCFRVVQSRSPFESCALQITVSCLCTKCQGHYFRVKFLTKENKIYFLDIPTPV